MKKNILGLMMGFMFTFSLIACGNDPKADSNSNTPGDNGGTQGQTEEKPVDKSFVTPEIIGDLDPSTAEANKVHFNDSMKINGPFAEDAFPSIGTPKMLVIPVNLDNSKKTDQTLNDIKIAFAGTAEQTGWESVKSYYYKSSYQKLNIDFVFTDWFTPSNDASYYETYSDKYARFSTTEGKVAKSLYKYNFMIESEQKAYCEEAEKIDSSDIREILHYNSGIHCVEKAISEYAEKYASYNKCRNSIEFFEKASNFVTKKINELSGKLSADKKEVRTELLKELGKKYEELKNAYSTESIEENNKHLKKFYNKKDNDSKILNEWKTCKNDNNYEKRITDFIKNDIVEIFLKKWHEEIVTFSRNFWINKTEDYKKECVKVITGSEITDEQKKSLSEIVFSADSPEFTDSSFSFESDFKVVKKLFGFISFIKWLNNELFSKIDTFLWKNSFEQNTDIQQLHSKEFNEWTVRLETELDKKMDEFNDQLRKWTEEIKDLENNRNFIENHLNESKRLLEMVVDKENQNG